MNQFSWPKIPLGLRIFLLYVTFVTFCAYIVIRTVTTEIKPGIRQSMEETLVDMSNLIAVLVAQDVKDNTLAESQYQDLFNTYSVLKPQASIWGLERVSGTRRVYITDKQGIVILDSDGQDLGRDYSRWNDVYLTLRGEYGARSTRLNQMDEMSTVMYVAAPIMDGSEIIGVVTVAKANSAMQPFIQRSQNRLISWSLLLGFLAILIGGLLAWRITRAVSRLSHFAEQVINGAKIVAPKFRVFYEFGDLAMVLDKMRHQLEGKNYAERYVQTLTHELKSPLAAIRGASEILQSPLSVEDRQRFLRNIENESTRVQLLIDRMLTLSVLEQQQEITDKQSVNLNTLCKSIIVSFELSAANKNIDLSMVSGDNLVVIGDAFLLRQALANLIDNAIDFTPSNGKIKVTIDRFSVSVFNAGAAIPDFAIARIGERFYSLARPASGRKSTGLGLNFALEVAQLHHASLSVLNVDGGVEAKIIFNIPSK